MKKMLTSCFGLGYLPLSPGTWGSLPPVALYLLLACLHSGQIVPGWAVPGAMSLMLICGVWGCVQLSPAVLREISPAKPDMIVVDEIAGAALALLLMPLVGPGVNIWLTAAIGFILFRVLDILKPWPCKSLAKLPGGWGLLADDLAAGLWVVGIWGLGRHLNTAVTAFVELFNPEGQQLSAAFAFFLGAVQGMTEFLPVSSSGHLVFFESFSKNIDTESPAMLLFDLCLHVGTVLSIVVVFRTKIVRFFWQLLRAFRGEVPIGQLYYRNTAIRFAVLALAATFTTGVVFVLFKDPLESARSLTVVALMWLVTATLLLASDYRHGKKGLRHFVIWMAVVIGLFQGMAILPGISRSGATICAAILLGLKVRWAIEFSFLISIPAILGGAVIQTIKHFDELTGSGVPVTTLLIGMAAAFIVGIASLKLLIRLSKKRELKYFAIYCALMALVTLISFL